MISPFWSEILWRWSGSIFGFAEFLQKTALSRSTPIDESDIQQELFNGKWSKNQATLRSVEIDRRGNAVFTPKFRDLGSAPRDLGDAVLEKITDTTE